MNAAVTDLMPGDVVLATAGESVKTLLGSCVSVILTDPRRTVAAMCHIVHVGRPNAANANNSAFGTVAMASMCAKLQSHGVSPHMCEAYVFGGGNMFPQLFQGEHIGETNANWVFDYLHDQGITVVDKDVGGTGYRKVSWSVGAEEPVVETIMSEQGEAHDR